MDEVKTPVPFADPFIILHNGVYYAYGTCTENGIEVLGHNALFTDKAGKLRLVFHAHKDKSNIHPRAMYIGDVSFEKVDGVERMRISKEYITPKLIK